MSSELVEKLGTGEKMRKPFIYIASLRRTGSTLLSELLSNPPYSFIFREPGIIRGKFKVKHPEFTNLLEYGIDLYVLRENFLKLPFETRVDFFKQSMLTGLLSSISQIGIKEIHHENWESLFNTFPNMKVVLTGRDPRDIYISAYYRNLERQKRGREPLTLRGNTSFTPENVAQDLVYEFNHQVAISKQLLCLKVKYEELCAQPGIIIAKIKQFVDDDNLSIGKIGIYSPYNRRVHGDRITTKQLGRWQTEANLKLVKEAHQVFELMKTYCEFWGYDAEGGKLESKGNYVK